MNGCIFFIWFFIILSFGFLIWAIRLTWLLGLKRQYHFDEYERTREERIAKEDAFKRYQRSHK